MPSIQTILSLCGPLGITVDQLLGEDLIEAVKNDELYDFLIKWDENRKKNN